MHAEYSSHGFLRAGLNNQLDHTILGQQELERRAQQLNCKFQIKPVGIVSFFTRNAS
uniref:Uncharacterized protein n=1 Tax=Oryza brachyantha TaxID=4533 RepID=J3MEL3_ORYBR